MSRANKVSRGVSILSVFYLIFILFGSLSSNLYSDVKCDGCKRTAFIENIDIDAEEIIHESSIRSLLVETVNTPCFRIQASKDDLFKPPEYLFWISYYKDEKEDIKSSLTISLHYNGKTEEHVKTWTTETSNPNAKFNWHKSRMFRKRKSELKKDRPIELTVLNDFEKRPYECKIELAREEIPPGDEVEVKISNINDIEGHKSREFNRIVVQALEGKIIGGEALAADPALKAFKVGKGTVTFKYKAPSNCRKRRDKIYVHNSCDILREDLYPLSKTELRDKIAEHEIKLVCLSGVIMCRHQSTYLEKKKYPHQDYKEQQEEVKEISVRMVFDEKPIFIEPDENMMIYTYRLKTYSIASYKYDMKGEGHDITIAPGYGVVERINWTDSRSGNPSKINPVGDEPGELVLYVDTNTQKVVDVEVPGFDIWVVWKGKHSCTFWNMDEGEKDCSYSLDKEEWEGCAPGVPEEGISYEGPNVIRGIYQDVLEDERNFIKDTWEFKIYKYWSLSQSDGKELT